MGRYYKFVEVLDGGWDEGFGILKATKNPDTRRTVYYKVAGDGTTEKISHNTFNSAYSAGNANRQNLKEAKLKRENDLKIAEENRKAQGAKAKAEAEQAKLKRENDLKIAEENRKAAEEEGKRKAEAD